MAQSLNAEQLAAFNRDGYVVVRGFYNSEEMKLIRAKADLDQHYRDMAHGGEDLEGNATQLSLWDYPKDDIYGMISRGRRLVQSMTDILGEEVYHWHSKMAMKDPGKGAWEWHQDYGYWYNQCLFPHLCSCYIAVDPATKENGCLQVLKGSHEMGRIDHGSAGTQVGCEPQRLEECVNRFELVYVELDPGDAVFFHCNMFHRSDANQSDKPRWGLICCYNTKSNRPVRPGHPDYNKLDIVEDEKLIEVGRKEVEQLKALA